MIRRCPQCGATGDDVYGFCIKCGYEFPKIKEMLITKFGNKKVDQTNTDFDLMVSKGLALSAQSEETSIEFEINNQSEEESISSSTTYEIKENEYEDF